jgi:hypothetical protein
MNAKLGKVLGWFVEAEEEPAPVVQPTIVEAAPIPRAAPRTFAEVYEAAGIDAEEQERVDRALELLQTLPANAPLDVKRAIVEASLRAFSIPIEGMLATVEAQLAALDAHAGDRDRQTCARIAELEAEIAQLRAELESATASRAISVQQTEAEKRRVRALATFFTSS